MPAWLLDKRVQIALIALAAATALFLAAHFFYSAGETKYALKQATAQLKHNQKVKNDYDEIDRQVPDGADKRAAIEWLRHYTRPDQ